MALFFRVIEQPDGTWTCRHGWLDFDTHQVLAEAARHITALTAEPTR